MPNYYLSICLLFASLGMLTACSIEPIPPLDGPVEAATEKPSEAAPKVESANTSGPSPTKRVSSEQPPLAASPNISNTRIETPEAFLDAYYAVIQSGDMERMISLMSPVYIKQNLASRIIQEVEFAHGERRERLGKIFTSRGLPFPTLEELRKGTVEDYHELFRKTATQVEDPIQFTIELTLLNKTDKPYSPPEIPKVKPSIRIEGDKAFLTTPNSPRAMVLTKIDGSWYWDPSVEAN